MAQSTTNLGKIHVFPSETLYNQFKDIIADNDLALLKDDGAYIVAALLEQNGYVKFSNGLILQWGTYETANASTKLITITFPVSFAVTAYSVALGHKGFSNWTNGANVNYVNKTVSDMTVYYCDGYGFSWLAIGMQQWGYGTWENTQRIITVTLPIPFTNTKYFSTKNVPMLADGHYTEDHEICTFNQTTTTFQFYHQHNAKIGDIYQWFAIGL